jgi:hypothetical protein
VLSLVGHTSRGALGRGHGSCIGVCLTVYLIDAYTYLPVAAGNAACTYLEGSTCIRTLVELTGTIRVSSSHDAPRLKSCLSWVLQGRVGSAHM